MVVVLHSVSQLLTCQGTTRIHNAFSCFMIIAIFGFGILDELLAAMVALPLVVEFHWIEVAERAEFTKEANCVIIAFC